MVADFKNIGSELHWLCKTSWMPSYDWTYTRLPKTYILNLSDYIFRSCYILCDGM